MSNIILNGLSALLMGTVGVLTSSADTVSSIFTREADKVESQPRVVEFVPPSSGGTEGRSVSQPNNAQPFISEGGAVQPVRQDRFERVERVERIEQKREGKENREPSNRKDEERSERPNGEDQQARDDERQAQDEARQAQEEARQKEMETKQLAQMKRDIKRSATEIARFKRQFDKFVLQKLTIPSDCSEALTQAQGVVDTVQNATTFEEVADVDMADMGDAFQTLNECRQNLERLARLPKMLKNVDNQIRQMERAWTRAKKGVPESAQDAVAQGDQIFSEVKTARARLDEQVKNGEIEDFESTLEDDVFGRFDDLSAAMQQIEAAKNAKRFVAQFTRNIKDAERTIAKLKKSGKDTAELEALLARAKDLYGQIKGLKAGGDEWEQAVSDLADLGQEFAEQTGGTEDFESMMKNAAQ